MKKKRLYINPTIVELTMKKLERYAQQHQDARTPMADACALEGESERSRFVRAAQRLHWNVTRTQGHVYENGVRVW